MESAASSAIAAASSSNLRVPRGLRVLRGVANFRVEASFFIGEAERRLRPRVERRPSGFSGDLPRPFTESFMLKGGGD